MLFRTCLITSMDSHKTFRTYERCAHERRADEETRVGEGNRAGPLPPFGFEDAATRADKYVPFCCPLLHLPSCCTVLLNDLSSSPPPTPNPPPLPTSPSTRGVRLGEIEPTIGAAMKRMHHEFTRILRASVACPVLVLVRWPLHRVLVNVL